MYFTIVRTRRVMALLFLSEWFGEGEWMTVEAACLILVSLLEMVDMVKKQREREICTAGWVGLCLCVMLLCILLLHMFFYPLEFTMSFIKIFLSLFCICNICSIQCWSIVCLSLTTVVKINFSTSDSINSLIISLHVSAGEKTTTTMSNLTSAS